MVPGAAGLKSKTISVKINNSFDLDKTFTIASRALAKEDLTVYAEEKDGKYEYTITVNEEGSNNLNELITSVTPENAAIETAEGSDGITRDNNTVSFTLVPVAAGWESKTISVKINNSFDLDKTFTIEPKSFTADNINVEVGTPTGNVYPLTITTTEGAPITKITDIDASEGTIATWTHGENKIETTLTVEAGWTDLKVNIKFNDDNNLVKENVVALEAKTADENGIVINAGSNKVDYHSGSLNINILVPKTLGDIESVASASANMTLDWTSTTGSWNNGDDDTYNRTNTTLTLNQGDEPYVATIIINDTYSIPLFTVPAKDKPGAASSPTSQGGFGARASTSAYTASAVETVSEPVKTHRVSLTSWVTDLFNNDSEVVTESVKDEVKATTTKAAKKAKKAQKASAAKVEKAPVEKPVVTETVESVAVTETVENAANVEEAAPEAKVTMTTVDASVTEIVAEDEPQSGAILWLALAALCAAIAGVVVLILKNRTAKK